MASKWVPGLGGSDETPAPGPKVLNADDYERAAKGMLPRGVLGYFASGALDERGVRDNREAFAGYRIRPRVFVDITKADCSTTLLGTRVASPIGAAPAAMQMMAHPDGEAASAKGAAQAGVAYTLSSWSNRKLEDVAAAAPDGLRWMQLYVMVDRSVTEKLIARAEAHGYTALVVTADRPVLGLREADTRNEFSMPAGLKLSNVGVTKEAYTGESIDGSLTWEVVDWIRSVSKLPVIVKGVLTGEDAACALAHGCAAVWVSDHGGRQLESAGSALDVLPEVLAAVRGGLEVYVDGGVRRGEDAFKALALGARAVFVGRPVVWSLTVNGSEGVRHMLESLSNELLVTMQLAGCTSVADIRKRSVAKL